MNESERKDDSSSVALIEFIDECQRELHQLGLELGLVPHDPIAKKGVPREICTTQRQERWECNHSSSVDLTQESTQSRRQCTKTRADTPTAMTTKGTCDDSKRLRWYIPINE